MTDYELTIYTAISRAVEKQIAKKPIEDGYLGIPCVCPSCGGDALPRFKYCPYCGQRLLWDGEKI